ncbi:MAG TPA: phosphotransferase [Dehalococcoidia bacterium]|jgi:aminoglycoside phosphotransferase (APT) family kinase protein|nr:phosphotransferase [Dehalococcoidia bacterium]
MPAPEHRLPPPSPAALAAIRDAIAPGGRVGRMRALSGGIDASMHALDLLDTTGQRTQVVVRRYGGAMLRHAPELERGYRTLTLLARHGYPAPRPLLFDPVGDLLGAPGYVMTRLPGRSSLVVRDLRLWTCRLAEALAALHGLPIPAADAPWLPEPAATVDALLGPNKVRRLEGDAAGAAVLDVVRARWDTTERGTAVLCHGDYWPGNTLWRRGKLTGVVDWDSARIDSAYVDTGYCRLDLALCIGQDAADLFLAAYEAATGTRLPDVPFWDLVASLRALPDPGVWLPSYRGTGRADITAAGLRANLAAFVQRALRALQTGGADRR